MEFRALGPLEVRRSGQVLELRGSKRRAVLAVLLLHANEVVRADRLIDEVWGDAPPANAAAALQNHVSRLRKGLGAEVVVTKPWGYVLRVDPEAIDLHRFKCLVGAAKPLAAEQRRAMLAEALALWRGPAFADLAHEPALSVEIARLEELRLAALEQRLDADLELGRDEELISELETLVAEHPLRERLRGQLILALYRSGRQAEALETYRETRRVLVEELGIEPNPELRELERAILRQDPGLASAPVAAASVETEKPKPGWRWPRSPLAAAIGILLIGGIGAAVAMLVTDGDGPRIPQAARAARPTSSASATPVAKTTRTATGKHTVRKQRTRSRTPRPRPAPAAPRPRHRTEHTSPRPTRSTRSTRPSADIPKAQFTPQRKVYWLTDDFEEPGTDTGVWGMAAEGPEALDASERNGQLELAVAPENAGNGAFYTQYSTRCRIRGDFDVRVEFKLVNWPSGDGVNLTLGAYFGSWLPPLDWMWVARSGAGATGGLETYATGVRSENRVVPTSDTAGALRITRVNGVLSTYYRKVEQLYLGGLQQTWVKLATGIAPHPANLVLSLSSNSDHFGQKAAVAAFDNFQATADTVLCGDAPLPPLKPRP
jgi:DNA-binding SARP family transcriptional activator